ncbi:molybdopterin molybdotransferase MoeA [Oryzifoliimicrobium ureilyticus]|uniref:molybdopterin molybdotransferase MoeA n=1 Tax=Oryzifoliimicrobium ureilyticus TaxID=3113724 RepID=UPI0030762360
MADLLPVEEALHRLLSRAVPLREHERIPVGDADRRVLSFDLEARITHPPFNSSAMDGYALCVHGEAAPGSEYKLIGEAAAGHAFSGSVGQGEAVRIFTGAPVPPGANTVLLQEDAEVHGGYVRTSSTTRQDQHIRPMGQDFREGETVLSAGSIMDFSRILVAAGMNCAEVSVYKKPLVGILATGDELVPPGGSPNSGQIIASSGLAVAALARKAGADVLDLGIVEDNKAAIEKAVSCSRDAGVDILVTLGGASVGDHDLVRGALVASGMTLDFWRIAMRPGKPLMVGSLDHIHVLGLPGNPVSTMVCALLFLEPLICKLAHLPGIDRMTYAKAGALFKANDLRQDYIRAQLTRTEDDVLVATPFPRQDSSMMKVFSAADCLVVRPPLAPAVKVGDPCPVVLLRG